MKAVLDKVEFLFVCLFVCFLPWWIDDVRGADAEGFHEHLVQTPTLETTADGAWHVTSLIPCMAACWERKTETVYAQAYT